MLHGKVQVGHGLRLYTLGGIDDDDGPVTSHQGASDLVGKVDVSGCIDEIQLVGVTVFGLVVERHRVALYRDTTLALQFHAVEHLIAKVPIRDRIASLNQPIRERGLAVVNMGDDAEVADVFDGGSRFHAVPSRCARKSRGFYQTSTA